MSYQCWARGQTHVSSIVWRSFFTRLQQTIAWCDDRVELSTLRTSLRTPQLEPPHLRINRDDEVCSVGLERERNLGWPTIDADQMADLRGGRLLTYFPDADLCDGAAAEASEGFFDAYNVPPWDTWIAYFEDGGGDDHSYSNYLICYVPRLAIPAALIGIAVNPEECIAWLADTDTLLSRALKAKETGESLW